MTVNEYESSARRTINHELVARDRLMNGVLGLCGEAGEAGDIVKKVLFQRHPMNEATARHIALELGDCLWYVTATLEALEACGYMYTMEDVMRMNTEKLRARYGDKFDARKSVERMEGDI